MYSRNYKIGYDKLKEGNASVTQLVDIAQDTSIAITNTTSRTVKWYLDNNQGWIFLNWNIEILKYPKYDEEIVCITIPVKFKKFLGQRDFRIENLDGEVMMNASTKTSLIDLVTKTPIEPTQDILDEYGPTHDEYITNKFKLPKVDNDKSFICVSITSVEIKRLDTDTNNHTNNVKYIEWAENEIPDDIYNNTITNLQVNYKKETFKGDVLTVETYVNNIDKVLVQFKQEGELHCEVMFVYKPI